MRVSASLGLVMLWASLVSCEQRNFDRCIPGNSDFQCESGKLCKLDNNASPTDPNAVGTCVSVECTAGAFPNGCAAETPICAAGRCLACTGDDQCKAANPAQPICRTTEPMTGMCVECVDAIQCASKSPKLGCDLTVGQCKPCTLNSQCASKVCAKDDTLNVASVPADKRLALGECVPLDRITTVDSSCGASCALQTVVDNANIDKPYVLVKEYALTATALVINAKAGLPELHITTGEPGDLSPAQVTKTPTASVTFSSTAVGAIQVTGGASVTIEGLVIFSSNTGVMCDSNKAGVPAATGVTLLRSILGLNGVAIRAKPLCKLTLDQTYIGRGPQPLFSMTGGNALALDLDTTEFKIVNSVFNQNIALDRSFGGISMRGSSGSIVNTTFYRHEPTTNPMPALAIRCPTPTSNLTIFNTLFVNFTKITAPYVDPACRSAATFDYIATDETLPLSGPGGSHIGAASENDLMGPSNGDLRLQKNAAAAVATGGTLMLNGIKSPTVDASNRARGQTAVSIGAFEVTP